ncbi:MAG: FKBP-type peptidyl-prolyl cis-trans isomerase [Thermodesulfobacteriota bacterium]
MKHVLIILGSLLLLTAQVRAAETVQLKTQKDKVSYILGINVGNNIKQLPTEIDADLFSKGFKDAQSGAKPLLSQEEMQTVMTAFQKEMNQKQADQVKTVGEKNKKEGEAFLAENKKKEGIKTLASGLQYKVLKEGKGKIPKATDKVSTHYQGTLIDGTEFDSSYKRGEPASFPVNGVIPGWTEALQLMKVGSKWQLFVPSKLGYGERGAGPKIGPNAVLIFTVELLSIN